MGRWTLASLTLAVVVALAWAGSARIQDLTSSKPARRPADAPVPVEVAAVERGPIERRRTFTGTLVPKAEFVIAPKVGGRVERLNVDLADSVLRGQRVAKLDDDEYVQSVAQAAADLAVTRANRTESESLLNIAERELRRVDELRGRGVASESQRDTAKANQLARQAHLAVTRAHLNRAESVLEAARIRLGYTEVSAEWRGGSEQRVVAERFVDEGETVAANAPLLRIIEMDPITAVFFVTERDYSSLRSGQAVELHTDAHANEVFEGRIARIAPVFRESTRQARVEVGAGNTAQRLKPGMFVRVTVVLDRVEDATLVPEGALVRRAGRDGVFVIGDGDRSVSWREVEVGIRQDGRVQISAENLGAQVVTLGQQLLDDDSAVTVSAATQSPSR